MRRDFENDLDNSPTATLLDEEFIEQAPSDAQQTAQSACTNAMAG